MRAGGAEIIFLGHASTLEVGNKIHVTVGAGILQHSSAQSDSLRHIFTFPLNLAI